MDATKIKKELDWSPKHSLEGAMETTVDWYLNHRDWVDFVRSGEYWKWIKINYGNRDVSAEKVTLGESH